MSKLKMVLAAATICGALGMGNASATLGTQLNATFTSVSYAL